VILGRHEDAVRPAVEHRVVRAAMTERQLEGLAPRGERKQLMAQADAEHRRAAE
jgi:hypothetical protein